MLFMCSFTYSLISFSKLVSCSLVSVVSSFGTYCLPGFALVVRLSWRLSVVVTSSFWWLRLWSNVLLHHGLWHPIWWVHWWVCEKGLTTSVTSRVGALVVSWLSTLASLWSVVVSLFGVTTVASVVSSGWEESLIL